MGPATYDLASLLRDSYVDVPEELIATLRRGVSPEGGAGRVARGLPAALRADVRPAEPEGPGHVRVHGHGAREPGLPALHAAHSRPRAAQPRPPPGAGGPPAEPSPATSRSWPDGVQGATPLQTVRIGDFRAHVGEEVRVQGWLHNKRSSGKLQFLIVRDGSGFAQAVVSKAAVPPEAWEAAAGAGQESSLELTGKVREDKRAPGGYEVDVTGLTVAPGRPRLPDHAQGPRHRLPDGEPPPLAALAAPARGASGCATR